MRMMIYPQPHLCLNIFLSLIRYMYPKWFLSPHFWSDKHKEMIWGEILAKRMSHCSPVIYYLGSQCRHMDEDNPLKEKLQLAIHKVRITLKSNFSFKYLKISRELFSFLYIFSKSFKSVSFHSAKPIFYFTCWL